MGFDLDHSDIFHKKDLQVVEKFKVKSTILKDLGPNALRVYNAIDSTKSVKDLINLLDLDEKEVFDMLRALEKMNLIYKEGQESERQESFDENKEESNEPENLDIKKENELVSKTSSNTKNLSENLDQFDSLSDEEKEIFQKYGNIGLKVYSMIDGYRSAQEIMEEASINETLLIEILNFFESKGIITLENKNTSSQSTKKEKKEEKRSPTTPFVEVQPSDPSLSDGNLEPVFVPSLKKLSILEFTKLKVLLQFKYGLSSNFLNFLDGSLDIIDIFFNVDFSFPKLKEILFTLQQEGYITLDHLNRENIEKKYSQVGLAIYKKFGLEGVLLYSFIGKTTSLTNLIKKAKLDPNKVSDILLFLSNIFGIDLKIDKQKLIENLKKN